ELERTGWLLGVITQNIDGLHQAAGSTRVWEVHGNLRICFCLSCSKDYDIDTLYQEIYCKHCGGLLRPHVVLFGDPMPQAYYSAEKILSGCQLLLVVGSSLQVQPVASLPDLSRQVVIINKEPTPWDEAAALVFTEPASRVLGDLVNDLKGQPGPYRQGND
ncbi:MAG: NAD-dependent deacetylase, partial [Firmicutes bacterium]|nr:NAD-dependent deacetylase [Bacillota bacterium]